MYTGLTHNTERRERGGRGERERERGRERGGREGGEERDRGREWERRDGCTSVFRKMTAGTLLCISPPVKPVCIHIYCVAGEL